MYKFGKVIVGECVMEMSTSGTNLTYGDFKFNVNWIIRPHLHIYGELINFS